MSSFLANVMDMLWMVIGIAIVLVVLRLYLRKRGAPAPANGNAKWRALDEIEPDRLKRLWDLMTSHGKVGLAVAAAALLACAQFFTTRLGLSNFIPWTGVAIMAAIGIQVILYLGAWLVAERSADKAYLRRKRREDADRLGDPDELRRAEAAVKSSGSVWTVIMFCTGLWVSVFFSFDALFDKVYKPEQQLLNNLKVARSTIGSIFGTMEKKIEEDRNEELRKLITGKDFQAWQANLNKILEAADNSKDLLQTAWNNDNNRLQLELGDARKKLQDKQTEVAKLKAALAVAKDRDTQAAAVANPPAQSAPASDEAKQLQERRDELQRAVTDLERQRDELQVSLNTEAKAGGVDKQKHSRRLAGEGPVWRELNTNLTAVKAELEVRRRSLEEVKRKVQSLEQAGVTAQKNAEAAAANAAADRGVKAAQLEQAEAEVKDLTLKVKDAESRYRAFVGDGDVAARALTGVGDQVLALRRALVIFNGTGSPDAYNLMLNGCNSLIEMLGRQEATKQRVGGATCDATALAPNIARLTAFQAAMAKYHAECQVDDAFNAMTIVKEMVDRARVCAGLSTLPFSRISYERNEIDRVEQENSPNTSHFERAIATLSRGDKLAWLALAIAFSIDFLVLVAAMLGARAADHVAPQMVLDQVSAAPFIDLTVYEDDPVHIQNQKKLLSLLRDDFESPGEDAAPGIRPMIDMYNVPEDVQRVVQPLLTMYVTNKMAQVEARRPGVYLLSRDLVSKLGREIGLYEKRKARRTSGGDGGVAAGAGAASAASAAAPADFQPDPMEPTSFAARRRQREAAAAANAGADRAQPRDRAARPAPSDADWQNSFRTKPYRG